MHLQPHLPCSINNLFENKIIKVPKLIKPGKNLAFCVYETIKVVIIGKHKNFVLATF